MRLVLDTSVVTSGFRSTAGASFRLLALAADGRFELMCTPALFLEYEDLLSRPEQMDVHGMSRKEVDSLMDVLAELIVPVQIRFQWRPQLADSPDEMVLEAAINGHAEAIVTHNIRDFAGVVGTFRIRILKPADALKEVQG